MILSVHFEYEVLHVIAFTHWSIFQGMFLFKVNSKLNKYAARA